MANTLAWGFVGLEHLFSQRLTAVGSEVISNAIQQSVDEHNRQVAAILTELAAPTDLFKTRFLLPGAGTLQPLDEWGNPLPVKPEGYYDVSFPIQGGGTAWGSNRITSAMMTVEEVNRATLDALTKDADWIKRHVLAALFTNVTWTYADPNDDAGSLTIQPLANGDAVTYARKSGALSTDNHFYAQAGAIADATNPYDDFYDELSEHVGAMGPYVAYIPTNQKAATQALAAFVEVNDPDIQAGNGNDTLTGSLDRGVGDTVLGKVNGVWVVEWSMLPNDYGIVVDRGAASTPLRMREYPASGLKGLIREGHSPDGNLRENRFIRYAGFGAYNRTAALAFRIGNGSYAIPTGYTAPLPV